MTASISIIVPCYNQAIYLDDCLTSVLSQSYTNWECIIVNDGSPDNTEDVAVSWCKKDHRFKYLRKENGGLSSARNAGIQLSQGTYILPLDADDMIGKEYCEKAIQIFERNDTVKVVYAEAEFFGEQTGIWKLPPYRLSDLALDNMIYCSAFFRKSDFQSYGGYDESFLFGMEDWDLWLGLLINGGDVVKLPDVEFFYRIKEISMTTNLRVNHQAQVATRNQLYLKHNHFYLKEFGDALKVFNERKKLRAELDYAHAQIVEIYNSYTFRLGSLMLKPLRFLKGKK